MSRRKPATTQTANTQSNAGNLMKATIHKRTDEPLLSREKIHAELAFEGPVPSRKDVLQEIAKRASVEPNVVTINKINTVFGMRKAEVIAYAYKSKAECDRVEDKKLAKKRCLSVEAPKAEAQSGHSPAGPQTKSEAK